MSLSLTQKSYLKLYYLFMIADGEITEGETRMFESICNEMRASKEEKQAVLDAYSCLAIMPQEDMSSKIIVEMSKALAESANDFAVNKNMASKVKVIWTMINLGFADTNYSEPEKRVVDFLADFWDIDNVVYDEMKDTAETILALTEQKEWIKLNDEPYDAKRAHIDIIDKNITQLFENMKIVFSEAEIA